MSLPLRAPRLVATTALSVVLSCFQACNGGSGGAAARAAPTIANLELSPQRAYQDPAPRSFSVAFDLFDPNRDVVSATFVVRDGSGMPIVQQTLSVSAPAASVRIEGGASAALPQLGAFPVEIWVTDASGLTSNALMATIDVEPYPWSDLAPDVVRRRDAAAVALDGQVYVIGGARTDVGTIPGPSTAIVARLDAATGAWSTVAELAVPRSEHAVAVAAGFVYAIGGENRRPLSAGTTIASVEQYDPITDVWSPRAPLPVPRRGIAAATLDGRIYVVGGGSALEPLAIVSSYDPLTDTWRPEPDLLHARYRPRAAMFGGRLVVAGGEHVPGGCENRVEVFDPATGLWTTSPDANLCATWLATAGERLLAGAGNGVLASDTADPLTWRGQARSRRGSSLESAACATGAAVFVFGDGTAERYEPAREIQ